LQRLPVFAVVAGAKHSHTQGGTTVRAVNVVRNAVDSAVVKSEFLNPNEFDVSLNHDDFDVSLKNALEILRIILADMPWYKKVILSIKFLIGGIEEYLRGKGWDV
jgi:hypothetical protein